MKNNKFNYYFGFSLLLLSLSVQAESDMAVEDEAQGTTKTQTIRTQDRFGTIEEERVKARYSTIHYIPNDGGDGYNLVGSDASSDSVKSAHSDSDELMIPSWQVFSW